jgi:hypothetical protein
MIHFTQQPLLRPIDGKSRNFLLEEDFPFWADDELYTIPKGFTTDLASIPSLFENIIDNDDPVILRPSIVHDWLYVLNGHLPNGNVLTRDECDNWLRDSMEGLGADWVIRNEVFEAVRLGGEIFWKKHETTSNIIRH